MRFISLIMLLATAALLSACGAFPLSNASPTPTPTLRSCAFYWASPDMSDEEARIEKLLAAAGIQATVTVFSNGEMGGAPCTYGEMDRTVGLVVAVPDLANQAALPTLAARIHKMEAAGVWYTLSSPPNSGTTLTFKDGQGKECSWVFQDGRCK